MAGFAPPPLPDVELPAVAWPPLLRRLRRGARRLLLGRGPMRSHVLQVLVAGQLYAVCSVVALHAAALGVLGAPVAALLAGGMGLTFALHYALVRSGCTAQLADPVIGGPMAVVNLLLCVAGYVLVGPVRGNLLILMAQTQLLAMFRMPPGRLVPLGLLGCALLAAAAAGLSLADPLAQPWAVTATHLGVAVPSLLATAFVTRWISQIRQRLRSQAVELRRVLGEVQQLATHDALTGLLNRRALDERLPALARRCRDQGRPLTVALIDIDHFKQVNDRHGHAGGDAVLASVAGVLARACPQPSLAARWGGEEFLLAWPGLSGPAAAEVMQWVARQLALLAQAPAAHGPASHGPAPHGPAAHSAAAHDAAAHGAAAPACGHAAAGLPALADAPACALPQQPAALPAVTLSAGLAERLDGEPLQALIDRADAALYRAKAAGRDRWVIDEPAAASASASACASAQTAPAAAPEACA